jgi:hypothetical protein
VETIWVEVPLSRNRPEFAWYVVVLQARFVANTCSGAVIAPLQSLFTSTTTVQTPSNVKTMDGLINFQDHIEEYVSPGDETQAASLRAALTSVSRSDPQVRLWSSSGAVNCTDGISPGHRACVFGQVSLTNMAALDDPFVAQLPAGYSSGLVRQFLPRVNSSATRTRISQAEFPSNCSYGDSFFANYSNTVENGYMYGEPVASSWHLIACMPGSQPTRPTNCMNGPKEISEQLYLNISAYDPANSPNDDPDSWSGLFKITLNTTSGYFEMPNYMNNRLPGPLLSDSPNNHCGRVCTYQGSGKDSAI